MTELQNETIAGDRGITPVGGGDNGRAAMLKRGFGALALTAFAFLIIWGTWKGDKPVSDSTRKLVIRQAAAFEPIPEATARTDHHGLNWSRAGRSHASGTRARLRPTSGERPARASAGL